MYLCTVGGTHNLLIRLPQFPQHLKNTCHDPSGYVLLPRKQGTWIFFSVTFDQICQKLNSPSTWIGLHTHPFRSETKILFWTTKIFFHLSIIFYWHYFKSGRKIILGRSSAQCPEKYSHELLSCFITAL